MSALLEALKRLSADELAMLLGRDTLDLLESLEISNLSRSSLAELVTAKFAPEEILANDVWRRKLFLALLPREAAQLAKALGCDAGTQPFEALLSLRVRKNTGTASKLYKFFGCEVADDATAALTERSIVVVSPSYPLFPHQRVACREVVEILDEARVKRVLLHMPTGSGKTRTAINALCYFLRKMEDENQMIVWLAHSEELCEQAAEEFEQAWRLLGDREIEIFRHFGPYRVNDLGDIKNGVLFAGFKIMYEQSLTHSTSFFGLARTTAIVVMDEAHQAIAPTYHHLLNLLAVGDRTLIMGLSATPGRSTLAVDEDIKLADFFARQKVSLRIQGYTNPVEFLQDEGFLARVKYVPLPYAPDRPLEFTADEITSLRNGFDVSTRILAEIAEDHFRNLLILAAIMGEADAGGKIIVFACSVEHANVLADLLRIKGYEARAITSRTPVTQRRANIEEYRDCDGIQILTNFGVLTTGFDAPRTNVAVICRPTSSVVLYSQMVGRAARGTRAGGNETCRVLTVVDDIPGFRNIAEAFEFWEDIWTN